MPPGSAARLGTPVGRGRRGPVLKGAVAVLAAVCLVTGCARLVLSQLDTLVVWYVDGYVDLRPDQKEMIRDAVARNLEWFGREEVPGYLALLETVRGDVEQPVTPELVSRRYDRTVELWDGFRRRLVPEVTALAATLDDGQVGEFFDALARDNRKLFREYSGSTAAERRKRQDRLVLRNLRRMAGRLTAGQESMVLARTARLHDLTEQWLDRRAAWQDALRQVLEDRRSPGFEARLAGLLLDTEQFDSPRYRQLVDENQREVFTLVAELAGSLSPAQRRHFQQRVDRFSRDIAALAVQSGGGRAAVRPATRQAWSSD
jgi:hypothetical protein